MYTHIYIVGSPKSSFWLFCNILWKNPNELFGQPCVGVGVCVHVCIHTHIYAVIRRQNHMFIHWLIHKHILSDSFLLSTVLGTADLMVSKPGNDTAFTLLRV